MSYLIYTLLCYLLLKPIVSRERVLDAVILTTGKDLRVFEKSVKSALDHLVDVKDFYVITPKAEELNRSLAAVLGKRVHFVEETIFPWNWVNVTEVMYDSVKQKGVYPFNADGKLTPFEHTLYSRTGWFLQQILKVRRPVSLSYLPKLKLTGSCAGLCRQGVRTR
jgi:hypothetical protein